MSALTFYEAQALSKLVIALNKEQYITFVPGCRSFSGLKKDFYVTARPVIFADSDGKKVLSDDKDIRDGYVWLTGTVEHFVPVSTLLEDIRYGFAVPDPAWVSGERG